MKKLSNNSPQSGPDQASFQPWKPDRMGSQPVHDLPSFLIEKNPEDEAAASYRSETIIKEGQNGKGEFQPWHPLDVINHQGWQDLPSSNPVQFSQLSPNHPSTNPGSGKAQTKAEAEMQRILAEAEEKAERIAQQKQEQRIHSAREEAQNLLGAAEAVLESLEEHRDEMLSSQEESILELVIKISQTIFGDGFRLDEDVLEGVIRDAMVEARGLGDLVLHLHPDDQQRLDPHWPEKHQGSGAQLQVVADPEIQPGGCLIEGEHGLIDARVSTKLEKIKEALFNTQSAHQAETSDRGGQS